jgi:hypothetical protein
VASRCAANSIVLRIILLQALLAGNVRHKADITTGSTDVRFWDKADMPVSAMSAFGGKADIGLM